MLKRLIRNRRTACETQLGSDASYARTIDLTIEHALGHGQTCRRVVVAGTPVAMIRSVVA